MRATMNILESIITEACKVQSLNSCSPQSCVLACMRPYEKEYDFTQAEREYMIKAVKRQRPRLVQRASSVSQINPTSSSFRR